MNSISIIGRLGKDPEVKTFDNGNSVAEFSVADSEYYIKDGEKQEKTIWIPCKAFGKNAEIASKYLYKGNKVGLQGRLTQESWESEGKTKTILKVVIERIELLEKKDTNGETDTPTPARNPNEPF